MLRTEQTNFRARKPRTARKFIALAKDEEPRHRYGGNGVCCAEPNQFGPPKGGRYKNKTGARNGFVAAAFRPARSAFPVAVS